MKKCPFDEKLNVQFLQRMRRAVLRPIRQFFPGQKSVGPIAAVISEFARVPRGCDPEVVRDCLDLKLGGMERTIRETGSLKHSVVGLTVTKLAPAEVACLDKDVSKIASHENGVIEVTIVDVRIRERAALEKRTGYGAVCNAAESKIRVNES